MTRCGGKPTLSTVGFGWRFQSRRERGKGIPLNGEAVRKWRRLCSKCRLLEVSFSNEVKY